MTQVTAEAARQSGAVRRSVFWILGAGAFGLAFSITTTAAYLPPLLHRFTESGTLIGLVLGAEGVFALTLSPVIGPWSDTFHTPMGRRRPFMLAALGPLGFCLLLMPFMPNLWTTTLIVLAFFFAYYVYEPPYRGLYPDVLPPSVYGRAQGIQHVLRGIALGAALVGGGFLLKLWHAAPFVLAAFVTTGACAIPILLIREDGGHGRVFEGVGAYFKRSWSIFQQEAAVRRFLFCNAAWEGTFAAARTFVVLYVLDGLHQSKAISSALLGAVATGYVIAALLASKLGDRFGIARVIFWSSWLYGCGFLVAGFASTWQTWYFALIIPVAVSGGLVMTLAWGLLFKLMPEEHRGAISGLATTTKGLGLLLGAPIAGAAIDLARPYLPATNGYQILWPVCAIPILAVIPLVYKLMRAEQSGPVEPLSRLMALWDRLRGLEVNVEEFGTERKSVDVSSQFTRVSTTVVLGGGGAEGRGEDVTYTAPDHDWFPQLEPSGRTTLQELSAQLDGLQLFDGEPGMAASRDYRRWAFESAALDLALRQNELSLGAALEREYRPVRFVVSTRDDAFAWLEHIPDLELKLDPENDWDRPFMERLAGTGRVRVLDLKAYYTGTPVDVVPDPELYRTVVELFPDAVLEDASLDGECGTVLQGQERRLSFDAPIHSIADVRGLPVEPGWLNIKPSRFGTTARLLECIEDCAARGVQMYGGGQFELGVGRRHIQVLASLFYAGGPNDVAPSEYNAGGPRPGLPRSPLPPPEARGF